MDEDVYPELGIAQTDWVVGQGSQELWGATEITYRYTFEI